MTGHVEEVDDNAEMRRSRYLDKRQELAKDQRISISVDNHQRRASTTSDKSFQELNLLKMMDQSRGSSA